MMTVQNKVELRTEFQVLLLIEDGDVIIAHPEDPLLQSSYRAIVVNDELAFMSSVKTGIKLMDNLVLMAIANSVLATLRST
jgi:hypothetical protein